MIAEKSTRAAMDQVKVIAERRLFLKRRWRAAADDGTDFGFDLEARLKHGCVIHQTNSKDYIILQEMEQVYELRPASADEAALMGWKIGNLHVAVQVIDGNIRVTKDVAVMHLMEREGWAYEELNVVFNPLRVTAHVS